MSREAFGWFLAGLILGAIWCDSYEPGFVPFSRIRYYILGER